MRTVRGTNKLHWYSGIVAIVVYIFALAIGGLLYPGYSHISMDVSQLTSTNSPIRNFMSVFLIYNLMVAYFGLGLYKLAEKTVAKVASLFIILIGLLGFLITWFPINTRGTEITFIGVMHIIIVSVISLMIVVSGFLFWIAYKKTHIHSFAKLSLVAGIGFVISGPIAAINVLSPYAGLYERIPIGIFLFWMITTSFLMLKEK